MESNNVFFTLQLIPYNSNDSNWLENDDANLLDVSESAQDGNLNSINLSQLHLETSPTGFQLQTDNGLVDLHSDSIINLNGSTYKVVITRKEIVQRASMANNKTAPMPTVDDIWQAPSTPHNQTIVPQAQTHEDPLRFLYNNAHSQPKQAPGGNVLQDLGIQQHQPVMTATPLLAEQPASSGQTYIDQSPVDQLDDYLVDEPMPLQTTTIPVTPPPVTNAPAPSSGGLLGAVKRLLVG